MTAEPMVFVNIGWMKDYAGPSASDTPVGGHGYLKDGNIGQEVFNFAFLDGKSMATFLGPPALTSKTWAVHHPTSP